MFGLEDPYLIIVNVAIIVICTLLAGMASGLNLAYFSLDLTTVSSLAMGVNETQAKRAKRILVVLQHPHWLLVTLLLMNAVAAESLPLALDDMMGPEVAIPVSVILVLFFGEIIPQSIFVSNAIAVCSFFAYFVYMFMILTAPISLLLGLLLDKLVGHREAMFYRRRELREFLNLQAMAEPMLDGNDPEWTDSEDFEDVGGVLDKQEIRLMMGALSLSETNLRTALKTRIEDVMCVDINARVTKELVERVFLSGKSRIPVYEGARDNCTHYFLSKQLVLQIHRKEEDAPLVKDLALIPARYIEDTCLMGEAYQILTAQPMHLLFVREVGTTSSIGIMTTSDVLESVHSAKFIDESDLTNQKPMQMLLKACWSDKSKEARASLRRSRGPLQRVGSQIIVSNTSNLGATQNLASSLPRSGGVDTTRVKIPNERERLASPHRESLNRNSYGTNQLQ